MRLHFASAAARLNSIVGLKNMHVRVIVQGVTREPSDDDADGSGFYTARDVEAQSLEHAKELVLCLVRSDRRSLEHAPEEVLRLLVRQSFEIAPSDVNTKHGYVYYDGRDE
jgi:hypothetical protein